MDPETARLTAITIATTTLALHLPGRDGLCPVCRVPVCDRRIEAVRALRAEGAQVPVLPPHPPRRPQWDCELCEQPWPCSQARCMLGDQYADQRGRPGLVVHMGGLLVDAARETGAPAGELVGRFLAWAGR